MDKCTIFENDVMIYDFFSWISTIIYYSLFLMINIAPCESVRAKNNIRHVRNIDHVIKY